MNNVERVATVMSYLATLDAPKSLTKIAQELKLNKATTYRLLRSLEKEQWVNCDAETGLYKVGYKIMQLGLSVLSRTTIKIVSERFLTELRDITGETVGLSIRVGNEPMFVEEMQSKRGLRYITPLGMRFPLWHGSIGKVILANMKESEISAILDELAQAGELSLPSGKKVNVKSLRLELGTIKKQGYAVSIAELEVGTSAVAAPVFDRNNEVMGAISVVGPSERFTTKVLKSYCKLVNEYAQKITRQIGVAPASRSIKNVTGALKI